jgi:hypothetical protein
VTVRAPKHRRKLATGDLTRGMDYCRVWLPARTVTRDGQRQRISARLIVSVPLTQTGAVFLDEESNSLNLIKALVVISLLVDERQLNGWPTYEWLLDWGFRKAGKRFVDLASPSDRPPAGALGYYSDGHYHVAVAVLTEAGRRLFIDIARDVISTNVAGYIFSFRHLT